MSCIILTYITTVKSGTSAWNGSSELFILHWQMQVSEYKKLVDITDNFFSTTKKAMLENSADGLAELRNVETTAEKLQFTNGDGHVSLLYSTAQMYDTQFTTIINSKGQKRTVYQHETISYENNEEYEYHIDTNIEDLIINFTNLNLAKQT